MTHQLDEDGTGQLQVKKSTYAAGGKPYASPVQALCKPYGAGPRLHYRLLTLCPAAY